MLERIPTSHRPHALALALGALLLATTAGCAVETVDEPAPVEVSDTQQDLHLFSRLCGGFEDKQCDDDRFCAPFLSRGCAGPRRIGVCLPKPRQCPPVTHPVCGCDGNTYTNFCEAAAAGVSIEHRGECDPSGEPVCGGEAGDECAGAGSCQEGFCVCDVVESCRAGLVWNGDPTVCGCVPDDSATCDDVTCRAGEVCVDNGDGTVACVPSTNPCDDITCRAGEVCVDNGDGTASCVPGANPCDDVTCRVGEICVDNGDGTASCVTQSTAARASFRSFGRP